MFTEFGGKGKDMTKGKVGEKIFQIDFLEYLGIGFSDVSNIENWQSKGIDFLVSPTQKYEVKASLSGDNDILIIEDYTNVNEDYGPKKSGWWYTTEATQIIFINNKTRFMIILKMTDQIKQYYDGIKEKYELTWNKRSFRKDMPNSFWQSAYRRIPLSEFNGFFSMYQKSCRY